MANRNVKVKIISAAARQVLNGSDIQAALLKHAQSIADGANRASGLTGYEADVQPGRGRAHAMAKTTDIASRADNASNNRLLTNLDGGRNA